LAPTNSNLMQSDADVRRDFRSDTLVVVDAIHGTIDTHDIPLFADYEIIPRLLVSPPLQRLRRVKQLDFASHAYPAADHSRYAHALGTMHIMRRLFNRAFEAEPYLTDILPHLRQAYPDAYSGNSDVDRARLLEHLLVAALLQDIGELPYSQATRHVYEPSPEMRESIGRKIGLSVNHWRPKPLFTVACLFAEPLRTILRPLHVPMLVHLITGQSPLDFDLARPLRPLRHMLDGAVDADRLDYVFRDAHHTIGGLGSADSVIESLLYYDESGPVVADPGPVSNFLATRAYLYSTVYHAPANRFRTLLLITLLRGVIRDDRCSQAFFGPGHAFLSVDDFLELDDVSLTGRITQLSTSRLHRRLGEDAGQALTILSGQYVDYRHFWLSPPGHSERQAPSIVLPSDLFFDTLRDQDRSLYDPGSVRVKADSYRFIAPIIPLEQCGGPFRAIFRDRWSTVPMPDSILVFTPTHQTGAAWDAVTNALQHDWLYDLLIDNDPLGPIDFPADTRAVQGCTGPAIFISFSWQDIQVVRDVARELFRRRRRYYLLVKPFQGVGDTPSHNSVQAVKEAAVVLLVASVSYAMRYRDMPDGNIAKEIFTMSRRVGSDRLPVVVLSADPYHEVESRLPWSALGFDSAPFLGMPLRDASQQQMANAIDEVLIAIDAAWEAAARQLHGVEGTDHG
jgi:HD superfamily phosphohydrolase